MAISYVGAGTPGVGTGAVTPTLPAGIAADDLLILSVESANEAVSTPSGWSTVTNSPQGTGTAGGTAATRLTLFYRVATSSESDPTVADPGNHAYASIRAFRGVDTASPINITAGNTAAASTAVTMPSVTTTVADAMIVWFVANATDTNTAQGSGTWTNAALTGIADAGGDNTNQGNGGGLSVGYGFKATAGSTGTTSTTISTSSVQGRITLALTPFVAQSPPTIVLNTVDGTITTDTTPTLEFTGTDPQSDDVRYQLQVGLTSTLYTDSYPESNRNGETYVGSGNDKVGQSFTGDGSLLENAWFELSNSIGYTDSFTVEVFAHSGTFGTSSVGTGAALATSDSVSATSIGSTASMVEFTFSGANQITLTNGTKYVIVVSKAAGTGALGVGRDSTSPTHAGNAVFYYSSTWEADPSVDIVFYVNQSTLIDKLSSTDPGFLNTVNGADTDPFTSGQKVSYTVQSALAEDTYYYRARAIDPSGSNTYSDWSSTQSLLVAGASYPMFSRRQYAADMVFSGSATPTLASTPLEGSLLVVHATERSGIGAAAFTITGSGWTKQIAESTLSGDSSARRSHVVWWKVAGASEPSSVQVTDGTSNIKQAFMEEYTSSSAVTWAFTSSTVANTGTGSTSPLASGSTASTSGNQLVVGSAIWRRDSDTLTSIGFSGLSTVVSHDTGGSNLVNATAFNQTVAEGTKSTSLSWTGTGHEGNVAVLVFTATATGGGGSTGQIKVYSGSSFVAKPVKVWNGSSWETKPLKRYNGSSWVTTTY